MGKRVEPREVFVTGIGSVEVADGMVRVVLTCTRHGEQIPVLTVVGPTSRVPEMAAEVLTVIGNAAGGRQN